MGSIVLLLADPHSRSLQPLEVRRLHVVESLSTPFEVDVVCVSKDPNLDLDAFIGRRANLAIDRGDLGQRAWGGVVTSVEALPAEGEGGLNFYALRVGPDFGLLEHKSGLRAFVDRSVIEIAERFLGHDFSKKLRREHPKHPLRVQRGEADFHFLSRLLEDDGISYTFASAERADQPSRLVLVDAPEHAESHEGALPVLDSVDSSSPKPFATDVRSRVQLRVSATTHLSSDFQRPRYQPSHHAKGSATGEAGLEEVHFTKATSDTSTGDQQAADRLASSRFERAKVTFTTNVVGLAPGDAVELERTGGKPQRLVVTRAALAFREGAAALSEITAVPSLVAIRPEHHAPRPPSPGVESAIVVGPEGAEIHSDEHGRVQLRFTWDHSPDAKAFWARVDAQWAGAGHGALSLPRVGSEVLVSHFHGDGDDPLVIGRLFNAADPPPHPLPRGAAKTTWRSRTTPDGNGGHELTFDDKKGAELVRVVSERDLSKLVKVDEHAKVHRDASLVVGGSRVATIGEVDVVDVGSLHEVRMAKVTTADGATSPEAAPLATRREIVAKRITLTSGGATIVLDGPDIVVAGEKNVRIQAGGTVTVQGQPYVYLNPPGPKTTTAGEKADTADHVVWFKLKSDGRPLAGVRVHVSKVGAPPDEATTHETDGNGQVRIPQPEPASFHVKVAHGTDHAPEGVPVATVPTQPTAHAKPSEHDMPVEFEILSPKPHTTFHLHTTPRMPEVVIEAKVLLGGKAVSLGHVGWKFRLEGDYRVRSSSEESYNEQKYRLPAGHVLTTPGQRDKYTLAPGALLGGELTLEVHFAGGEALGGVRASKKVPGLKVLGRNPPRSEVEQYIVEKTGKLAWLYLRMFQWESGMVQFAEKSGGGNTPGYPLYGPPSGVGMVQRDPVHEEWHFPKSPVTEPNEFFPRIFWNWKHNLDEGIHSFSSDYIERGRADLDELRREHHGLPMYPEGVLLRAAIRRYNGGIEYGVSGDGRHYVVSPTYTNNPGYVNDVLDNPEIDSHEWPVPHDARATEWP